MVTLYIIVPCYNEEAVLHQTASELYAIIEKGKQENLLKEGSSIVFVNDGSKDKTWQIIEELNSKNAVYKGIKLSRNAGHQMALLSGLLHYKDSADVLVSIDADLQDDVKVILEMVKSHLNGAEIVYGVRKERKTDTFFKKYTALFFYKLMQILGVDIVYNHADYRLMSKRALEAFSEFEERNLFIRGIIPLLGFKTDTVYYNRLDRFAGESKYPFGKMFAFAIDGITSFSVKPLRLISVIGFFFFVLSILLTGVAFFSWVFEETVRGWLSTVIPIYFIGGVQLLSLGVIGEYIGKIYREVKARPRFIIEKTL